MTEADLKLFREEFPKLMGILAKDKEFEWVHHGILLATIIDKREVMRNIMTSICHDIFNETICPGKECATQRSWPVQGDARVRKVPKVVLCKVPVLLTLGKQVSDPSEWMGMSSRLSLELKYATQELIESVSKDIHAVNPHREVGLMLARQILMLKMLQSLQWRTRLEPVLPLELLVNHALKPDHEIKRGRSSGGPRVPWITEDQDVRVLYNLEVSCHPFSLGIAIKEALEVDKKACEDANIPDRSWLEFGSDTRDIKLDVSSVWSILDKDQGTREAAARRGGSTKKGKGLEPPPSIHAGKCFD
jgi:hypothetical protein